MQLITALQNQQLYDHPVSAFEFIETHISWVILTGDYVYKIKKPVNFGFLDFSTLAKRKYYCEEELRLNKRLAPDLYLEVIAITGSEQQPQLNGSGTIIEYAVKMRQFPQSTQLDRLLQANKLTNSIIDKLADKVALFHSSIIRADSQSPYGDLEHIRQPVEENFQQIRSHVNDQLILSRLSKLERWSQNQLQNLADVITTRKLQGYVRECHGDMHLRNIAFNNNDIIIFDCIEFNPNFYWIDVISEIAFVIMDLEDRQQYAFASRFLNRYLHASGDYTGLVLLDFYKVYRAMVRAKVDALRLSQTPENTNEHDQVKSDFLQYLSLAETYTQQRKPVLLITHGLSGSGKSYATQKIIEHYPAIWIRSDTERKRLFDITPESDSHAAAEQGIYTQQATTQTYSYLSELASKVLNTGYPVIIDAANLKLDQRLLFKQLADSLETNFYILDFTADVSVLRARIEKRHKLGNDASDATLDVLEHQLKTQELFTETELPHVISINTVDSIDIDKIISRIN